MTKYFTTTIGLLRLLAFLEGVSLLLLVFVAMPYKYLLKNPVLVKTIGPVHGVLFSLFIVAALYVSVQQRWNFWKITWKVLLSCMIPFGTFYVDYTILRHLQRERVK